MKNIKIIIILFLLFGFASVYSQQTQATKNDKAVKSSNTLTDPKLSQEEQTRILNAGKDNPAKIDESQLVDPKIDPATMPTEKDFGESNAKVEPVEDRKEVIAAVSHPSNAKKVNNNQTSQPQGKKSDNVINYRNMNGPNEQPTGKKPSNVINYRNMNGSNSQPKASSTNTPNKIN